MIIKKFIKHFIKSCVSVTPTKTPVIYSGIVIGLKRNWLMVPLLRRFYPEFQNREFYEEGLKAAINKINIQIESATIIGGGYGAIAVYLHKKITQKCKITIYEASVHQASIIRRTMEINSVFNAKVINMPVGATVSVYNSDQPLNVLPANDLLNTDLLIMDCEGAEKIILDTIIIKPKVIIVETHGFLGSGTNIIREKLLAHNYDVLDMGLAEPNDTEFCLERDIKILYAWLHK